MSDAVQSVNEDAAAAAERYERQLRLLYPDRYPHVYDGTENDGFCAVYRCGKPRHDPIHTPTP